MKTSRIALWILCLALVASCNKNNGNTGDDVPENGFRAKIEQTKGGGSKGNRTHINPEWDPNGYSETPLYWSEDDLIKVSNQSGTTLTFQLTEGENTMYGTFYTGEQNDGFFEPDYMAAYPAANAEGTATTISGSTATFSMLSTQSYKANTFDEGAMPMVASSSTQTLDFYNVFGGLCIPLCGDGLTVTSVKLTSLNTTDKLWGVFSAVCTSSTPLPTYESGGDYTLTLDCGEGVALNATTPTDFYFMVPPGTLESGFKVEAYNGSNKIYEKSTSSAPGSGFIPRSVVMKVNTSLQIVVEPLEVLTVNPTSITKNSAFGLGQVKSGTPTTQGLLFIRYDQITDPSNPAADLVLNSANTNVLVTTDVVQGTVCYGSLYDGLDVDTKYYVRAFATNSAGIPYYGDPVLFTTLLDYSVGPYPGVLVDPNGVPFEYSVSPTRKVWFSAGNLQFNAAMGSHNRADGTTAPGTWRFAEHQWDFVGDAEKGTVYENGVKCDNALISSSYGGWIDLFGWATSGYRDLNDPHVRRYYPYSWENDRIENDVNEYGYGPSSVYHQFQIYTNYDLTGEYANYDWGVYNAISNGGNAPGQWRTLLNQYSSNYSTSEITEWAYLISPVTPNRPAYRVLRAQLYVNGNVNQSVKPINYDGYDHWFCGNTVNGLVIFPDSFTLPEEGIRTLSYINNITSNLSYRPLSEAEWSVLERAGCIFLPATGRREVKEVIFGEDNNSSKYDRTFYSSTAVHNSACVRLMRFSQRKIEPYVQGYYRCTGFPVRLVRDVE